MHECHDRLDPVFMKFIKKIIIEGKTLLIRRFLIASRVDPGPGYRNSQSRKAHFRKQGDIFLIGMIEIDRLMAGIILPRIDFIMDLSWLIGRTDRDDIHDAWPFAVKIPGSLTLVCSQGSSVKEITVFH